MNLLTTPDFSHGLLDLFDPPACTIPVPTDIRMWRWCDCRRV